MAAFIAIGDMERYYVLTKLILSGMSGVSPYCDLSSEPQVLRQDPPWTKNSLQAERRSLTAIALKAAGGSFKVKPTIPHDSFLPSRYHVESLRQTLLDRFLAYERHSPTSLPYYINVLNLDSDHEYYDPECERKINEYVDKNLPISLSSIKRALTNRAPSDGPGIYGYLDSFRCWVVSVAKELLLDAQKRFSPIQASLDQDQQTATSPTAHSQHAQFQAQAFSSKGGPVANRKPATLPLRQ